MIKILRGKDYGFCIAKYTVTISKPMAVGDFIEEWLKENPHTWGIFTIKSGILGYPEFEYRALDGLISKPDDECFSRKIKNVKCYGGYGRFDFSFELEEEREGKG